MVSIKHVALRKTKKYSFQDFIKEIKRYKTIYIMLIPVALYYLIFHYGPMYGLVISFKDFSPRLGVMGSEWVGLKHFQSFFSSYYAWRVIRNTFLISVLDIALGFPAPILLALLLNEIHKKVFKRTIQTITYLPHFISMVVICGILKDFLGRDGAINDILNFLGFARDNYLQNPDLFRGIYVGSGIWQGVGYGSIIYLAAISGIDQALYEAATIDGAGRFKKIFHVTIPGILPTIIILFILRVGNTMTVGFEKIMLLYSPVTYETADVISTFVYRMGLEQMKFSYSAAIGLFNSVINFILLLAANKISKRFSETSLW
ncbi:sugar ABC transporter permease [Vallitalea pronyensis]|uniref:Sugar ABC transporter permease n=1 Tax=Vallitalea pronyensis TaxID=1348613 RepID=A0A8J8MLH3_9FIRM|nr:ABC transporter permease subunit [Vallitalea pronyensis]QUI24047.1 sugar ABC transporter permease [Vallitalea pronyensis]